jgi:hypothetical protein
MSKYLNLSRDVKNIIVKYTLPLKLNKKFYLSELLNKTSRINWAITYHSCNYKNPYYIFNFYKYFHNRILKIWEIV